LAFFRGPFRKKLENIFWRAILSPSYFGWKDMARTRTSPVELDDDQIATLTKISEAKSEDLRRARRARILLMAKDGASDDTIAEAVSLNKNSVRNTISKFTSMGFDAALSDLARSGRPTRVGDDAKAWVISQARVKPKQLGYAQEAWTIKGLTRHIQDTCKSAGHEALSNIASSKVWTILDDNELKTRRVRYRLERREPDFDKKTDDVLLLYKEANLKLNGKANREITVSYGERPGARAIANIAPDLAPAEKRGFLARDDERERLGTLSFLAGLNLLTGQIAGLVRETRKSSDFLDFLKLVDEKYATADRIRLALDKRAVRASKETRKFLDARPLRFEFIFTPKHGSWLNLVESFFDKLVRVFLRGVQGSSKEELIARIYQRLDEVNKEPVVYRWKFKMDEVDI
jgi:transposase